VELTKGKGIYISTQAKNQIKVDHLGKPFSMARDVLFELYGKEAFQSACVTARGTVKGKFGIYSDVLSATLGQYNCCFFFFLKKGTLLRALLENY